MSRAAPTLTLDQYRLPWTVRSLNGVGGLFGNGALMPAKLTEETLLAQARRVAGRPNGDAGQFTPAFRMLLSSITKDAGLTFAGRIAIRDQLVRNLSNAMQIDNELERDPGIAQETISKPLFIVGFPRTGTTLLHRLLACLPEARFPRLWELLRPAPPPDANATTEDPRVALAEKMVQDLSYLAPHIQSIHPFDARGPEECFHLLENTFMCAGSGYYLRIPSYLTWLAAQDMTPAYARYRLQLQLLQRRNPGRWILKWPGHLLNLEPLLANFPDAGVIHTHRNLCSVAASSCSYSATLQMFFSDIELSSLGDVWMRDSRVMVDQAAASRERLGPSRFFDLQYEELVADPIGSVRRICDRFEVPVTPEAEARMREHLRASTGGEKHGGHRYSLEQFGLDRAKVTTGFADYHQRYGVAEAR